MKYFSYLLYGISVIFIGMGLHRLFVYENSDSYSGRKINTPIGEESFDYIINAGQATAFFVVATLLVIVAGTLMIIDKMNEVKNNKKSENSFKF